MCSSKLPPKEPGEHRWACVDCGAVWPTAVPCGNPDPADVLAKGIGGPDSVRRALEGRRCMHCERPIGFDGTEYGGAQARPRCIWRRDGDRWVPGCGPFVGDRHVIGPLVEDATA